jgi:hypothetical protein
MPKWRIGQNRFRVKVSYRDGKTRATIALPVPLLELWSNPEYLVIYGQDGKATVEPDNVFSAVADKHLSASLRLSKMSN